VDQCRFCGFGGKTHDPNCPEKLNTPEARRLWEKGRRDGRAGAEESSDNPTYLIGWVDGALQDMEDLQNSESE